MDALVQALKDQALDYPLRTLLALSILVLSIRIYNRPDLSHVPTAGYGGLLSYYDSFRYIVRAKAMLQEGYDKYRKTPGFFKIASPSRWSVIISSPEMINELRLAKSDELSSDHANEEEIATPYTLGLDATMNMYHLDALRTPMTRNIAVKFNEVYDEISQSFEDLIPATHDEWLAIPALPAVQKIVCRTTNRLFLWESLCRNPEWLELNIRFTIDVFLRAIVINLFPRMLQPLVGRFLSPIKKAMRITRKLLLEEVAQRVAVDAEYGKKYEGRPNDLISWLLGVAPEKERTAEGIMTRVLIVNIAAIHTSSNSFYLAILRLAANPEYVAPMREEVMHIVEEYGWTKDALNRMHKVDSFLKESARCQGISALMIHRKVVKKSGYTFANGLHLPYGTWIDIPTFAIHQDQEFYDNPSTFDGFRFSKMRAEGDEELKHQMVSTSLQYLNFGHGKHACPGRFFATTELKAMMAHLLVTYDIRLESVPKPFWLGPNVAPDAKVEILFRRLSSKQ